MIMLFRFAIAAIASVSNLPAAHGSGGFIRRVESADGSNVDPPAAAASETKLGKANKEEVAVTDDDALNVSDMEASLFDSIDLAQPGKLQPEPRFFSIQEAKDWNHGTTSVTSAYDGTIKFYAPEDTEIGDTLFLFLHRTDGYLPLRIDDDWTRGAEVSHSKY